MPLSQKQRQALIDSANERGLDPDKVIAEAERRVGGASSGSGGDAGDAAPARPVADRMLIGFIPFVTVREFRELWLGLDARLKDDDLPTGEWLNIHGESVSSGGSDPEGGGQE